MTVSAASTSLASSTSAAPALDPLEFARGALSAATFVATDGARETHVAKLHILFERAGVAPSMADAFSARSSVNTRLMARFSFLPNKIPNKKTSLQTFAG